jgi:hypothetical protein
MKRLYTLVKLMMCVLVFGFWHPAFGLVKDFAPNIDRLWDRYLTNDAWKSPVMKFPYEDCFRSAARTNDLPVSLLVAVARGESNFNPAAKSNRNCHGLMQIQWPGTAHHLGIYRLAALYDPCTNIRAGARYLRELMDRYDGDLHLSLAAYNYGPRRIPTQSNPAGIPDGARWYSGYIYHHLKQIMRGVAMVEGVPLSTERPEYNPAKRLAIITFSKPYRAAGFYQYLQRRAPALRLDWYRIGLGRYQVVMLYADERTLQKGKKILGTLGITVKARR